MVQVSERTISVTERVKRNTLMRFGHVEGMNATEFTKMVQYMGVILRDLV